MAKQRVMVREPESTAALDVWRALVEALRGAGEAALRASASAGTGAASRILEPLFDRAWRELRESGTLSALQEIGRLTELDEDWDGTGGRAVTHAAHAQALDVLTRSHASALS